MLTEFDGDQNFLLVTLDSCRWDAFMEADTCELNRRAVFKKAYAQATYTMPSHLSMFSGIFPGCPERIPYYNRFARNLFRIRARPIHADTYLEFPGETQSIFEGYAALGYRTLGIGALEWFHHRSLQDPFQEFVVTGIYLRRQVEILGEWMSRQNAPFAAFLNIGETHEPYECGGLIHPSLESRARMRAFQSTGFQVGEYRQQVNCCRFIDEELGRLLQILESMERKTVLVICGDHGECFGEDGLYGHGFFHPRVMEVPLGITEVG